MSLISWLGNVVEGQFSHSFFSTKFSHQDIRWNFGILRSGYCSLFEIKVYNIVKWKEFKENRPDSFNQQTFEKCHSLEWCSIVMISMIKTFNRKSSILFQQTEYWWSKMRSHCRYALKLFVSKLFSCLLKQQWHNKLSIFTLLYKFNSACMKIIGRTFSGSI